MKIVVTIARGHAMDDVIEDLKEQGLVVDKIMRNVRVVTGTISGMDAVKDVIGITKVIENKDIVA